MQFAIENRLYINSIYTLLGYDLHCGESDTATVTPKTAVTPNYPNNYNNNLDCEWTISAPHGGYIVLNFLDYVVESCCDFLYIGNFLPEFYIFVSYFSQGDDWKSR